MAYEYTEIAVTRSQQQIRDMVYKHKGTGINFISQRPKEGFEALVQIGDISYHIRVMAMCKVTDEKKIQQEERRVWRVLFFHLKTMFEAADSGVLDLRDVIMPYVVTPNGKTISEHIIPQFEKIMQMNADNLLTTSGVE